MNVIKTDPKIQIKIKDILDENNRILLNNQMRIGYDTLIQNVILRELITLMGATIVDIDIELKTKFSRIKYLESKLCITF